MSKSNPMHHSVPTTDLYAEVTQQIITALEAGTPPWVCPWDRSHGSQMPGNLTTGRRYRGTNVMLLNLRKMAAGCQFWLEKTGKAVTKATQAMQQGTEVEPAARAAYEGQTGLVMQPLVLEAGAYSASLDGMTLEGDLLLEIKCPLRGTRSDLWQGVLDGRVPEHYRIQVQHQLMVSGAETAHLWVYDGSKGILCTIERYEGSMFHIQAGWDEFQRYLDTDTPPPLTEADALVRSDATWMEAALTYAQAKQEAEVMAEKLEQARQALLALVTQPKESGAGVTVTRYWKQGNVDYKKIPALQGVD